MEHLSEKCGVFGIFGHGLDVSRLTFFGLFALQHRGQESSGIAATDGKEIRVHKGMGLVTHIYNEDEIKKLAGHIAIGHNRYSTSLGTGIKYAQPIVDGAIALAHNGNLPSVEALKKFLAEKKVPFDGLNDTGLMARAVSYYVNSGKSLEEAVKNAMPLFTGAYCIVALDKSSLVVARDECGIRPLSMGKLNGGYVFASETCAFKTIGAEFMRDVNPGEMIVVDEKGMRSEQVLKSRPKLDIFEFVYFARPDSTLNGKLVYDVRHRFGMHLAKEFPVKADIVVPVPDTAIPAAIGYSQATGIPLEMALIKNRYIHRTFIEPEQHSRDLGVQLKLSPLKEVLEGKRVVIIDDSIVRGTTSRQIVKMLFDNGVKEVHFLVCSPPLPYPDFYGIDIPKQESLIAFNRTIEEIREHLGATSLHYLSLEGMVAATELPRDVFSLSCFTGEYPIDLHERAHDVVPSMIPEEKAKILAAK